MVKDKENFLTIRGSQNDHKIVTKKETRYHRKKIEKFEVYQLKKEEMLETAKKSERIF